jgi:acetolactate synthase I/II/III large subunit
MVRNGVDQPCAKVCQAWFMGNFIMGHAGHLTIESLRRFGVDMMFTLNGGHIWPLYEAARLTDIQVVDTRHEQTATFAAEAYAKLTRRLGVAALTAGPGVTNGVSAVTSAMFNGSPLMVLGGRAPQLRWGSGSLQEFDHLPVVRSITKRAETVTDGATAGALIHELANAALAPHRGPVFADFPLDVFGPVEGDVPVANPRGPGGAVPDPEAIEGLAAALAQADRPALIVGSDVYWAGAWDELRQVARNFEVPVFANGLGRGLLSADDPLAFQRTRGLLSVRADLVVVIGAPLDFRLGFGSFGAAQVMHVVDAESQRAGHVPVPTVVGDLALVLADLAQRGSPAGRHTDWLSEISATESTRAHAERALLEADTDPIKPGRIYGELGKRLESDAVVICDGGDFASYAGKLVQAYEPGCWLDTGPYGCLGNGMGYAMAARAVRPSSQVVVLLGDGAAGFSLMDVDSLVRHRMPVVMIVGNNGIWGLEKHPMQAIYGWDMACDLQPGCRYDEVVRALGGGGETVNRPGDIGPALDRAFASGVPYLVNVITDPADMYPRTSNLA